MQQQHRQRHVLHGAHGRSADGRVPQRPQRGVRLRPHLGDPAHRSGRAADGDHVVTGQWGPREEVAGQGDGRLQGRGVFRRPGGQYVHRSGARHQG